MNAVAELQYYVGNNKVLEQFSQRLYEPKAWFDLRLQAEQLTLTKGFDRLLSLEELPLHLYDHQRHAVLRVLRHMRGRALLADEVGLGKTIEAGVILREYLVRGLVHRVLILVPSTLVGQWREELAQKLGIRVHRVAGIGQWSRHEQVIASLDLAKRPEHAQQITAIPWDMVIVDEAHRLKSQTSVNWQFVNALHKKFILLLTATPVQNDLRELYNLITLLKPGQLHTYSRFKRDFTLDRHSPRNVHLLRELLDDVMVRTSRRETLMRFPRREVRSVSVPMSDEEHTFYSELVRRLRDSYLATPKSERNLLPYILLLRQATSHPIGSARTLRAMHRRGTLRNLDTQVVSGLAQLASDVVPGKFSVIQWALYETDLHAILFTAFKESMHQLVKRLRSTIDRPVLPFHAGMDPDARRDAIERFRLGKGVLVSTEAGSEGMNLQFCNTVINYDLPWNPLRLEQRIGRVHRIGQSECVRVYNLATEGTVESYILYLLDKKINMFSKVVGELEGILSNMSSSFDQRVAQTLFESSPDELSEQFERFGQELEQAAQLYEKQRGVMSTLFDLGQRAQAPGLVGGDGHDGA